MLERRSAGLCWRAEVTHLWCDNEYTMDQPPSKKVVEDGGAIRPKGKDAADETESIDVQTNKEVK